MATRIELRSFNTGDSNKCCLVRFGGPKWLHVLLMDKQLTVIKVPKGDERYMSELTRNGKPYPMSRAVRVFRSFGRSHGLTKAAKSFLREVSQPKPLADVAKMLNDQMHEDQRIASN